MQCNTTETRSTIAEIERSIGNVTTVREMWGLKAHHQADGVHIVCIGEFTPDAASFASGKPIHLVTGQALLELIKAVQVKPDIVACYAPRGPTR